MVGIFLLIVSITCIFVVKFVWTKNVARKTKYFLFYYFIQQINIFNNSTYLQFIEETNQHIYNIHWRNQSPYLQFIEETNHHIYNSLKKPITIFTIHWRNQSTYLQFIEATNHHIYNSLKKPITIFTIHWRNKATYLQFIEETYHHMYNSYTYYKCLHDLITHLFSIQFLPLSLQLLK